MASSLLTCIVLVASLAGCDDVFGLHRPPDDAAIDGVIPDRLLQDPNGDFDGDGILNGIDKCPTMDGVATSTDQDGDGVGDRCDPHPAMPGDCLLLFDDFGDASLSMAWKSDPTPLDHDRNLSNQPYLGWSATPEEVVWLDLPLGLDAISVFGYVQQGATGMSDASRYALHVYPALGTPPVVTGSGCGVESNGPGAMVSSVQTQNGNDGNVKTSPIGTYQVGSSTDFEIEWSATADVCRGTLRQALDQAGMVPAAFPAGGQRVGLRGIDVGIYVYAIAGWGRCP